MKIKILGAHNTESKETRNMTLLVDNQIALDAGGLTSTLSFQDQLKLKAVLLTHHHYDHMRDIPALAMNLFLRTGTIDIYTHQAVYDNLTKYFLNGDLYPEYHKKPEDNPVLRIHILEPDQETIIEKLLVKPVPVNHSLPAMGYQLTSVDKKTIFYTGDTGVGLSEVWKKISPQVLFIELTAPNRWEDSMKHSKHLTPSLLKLELTSFKEIKGYLPRIITVHMNPETEEEIRAEIAAVAESLGANIQLAYEGMEVLI